MFSLVPRCSLAAFVLCGLTSGLLQAQAPPTWQGARWVWNDAEAAGNEPDIQRLCLRRAFDLPEAAVKARLLITADNGYTVHVNGRKVGADGQWNSVETYQVAELLVKGTNVLAVTATNDGGPAGVLAWLHVQTKSGHVVIASDRTWKTSEAEDVSGDQWLGAAFDDAKWTFAAELGGAEMSPWGVAASDVAATGAKSPAQEDVNVADRGIDKYGTSKDEQARFQLPPGFQIELLADEPLIINPVCLAYDSQGRMLVSESHTYRFGPKGSPVEKATNPIVRLEPKPGGGYTRELVAEGFEDPVMGMLVRGDQLFCTANNFLYQYDLPASGPATNRRLLMEDKNKAWNPFGMFVLEQGPDDFLYLSVGNHEIDLQGPGGKLTGRGGSGIVSRFDASGKQMERLVHGLRVPYSFEFDPFGQLWVLSNGEGNPNRFVRVIQGVDYHCYSRPTADNAWLAGKHPLAPPCFELPGGACTQLVRYHGANFPASYQGSLLLDNWGRHGFGGANRTIFRYVPNAAGEITTREPFLSCSDPHFRCSHLTLSPDGGLIIVDWYGRDDESDLTGRIWKVTYTGNEQPVVEHAFDSPRWNESDYRLSALGSPSHVIREKAAAEIVRRGAAELPALEKYLAATKSDLGAAGAIWAAVRIGGDQAWPVVAAGTKHADARVVRLAIETLRRFAPQRANEVAATLAGHDSPAVRVAAAISLTDAAQRRTALLQALQSNAGANPHTRYEACWHLAALLDKATINALWKSSQPESRLAALITVDVALFEAGDSRPLALEILGDMIGNLQANDADLVLPLAKLNRDAVLLPALAKLSERDDLSPATSAAAVLLMRQISPKENTISPKALARVRAAAKSGQVAATTSSDSLLLLEALSAEGSSPLLFDEALRSLTSKDASLRELAHKILRQYAADAGSTTISLWGRLQSAKDKTPPEQRAEVAATLLAIESLPDRRRWEKVLLEGDVNLARDIVRSWRAYAGRPAEIEWVTALAPQALTREPAFAGDLAAVFEHLKVDAKAAKLDLPAVPTDATVRRKEALAATTSEANVWLGRRVFERAGCVKCHTTVSANALRAPSLAGIGKAQPPEYLMESLFEPSKVIKTGFETESVVLDDGRVLSGLVKEEGAELRIITADTEIRVAKTSVEKRQVQKVSLMPERQADGLSQAELVDVLAYLKSLK